MHIFLDPRKISVETDFLQIPPKPIAHSTAEPKALQARSSLLQ